MKRLQKDRIIEFKEIEETYCRKIFQLEKELGAYITEKYPLMKFHAMYDELCYYYEEMKREQNRQKIK